MRERFTAVIQQSEGESGAYVEVPLDVERVFGAKRVKVKAWFDGCAYRGSIVRMGGCYLIGLTQALRQAIGKQPGDVVAVEVEKDTEERVVELPADLKQALALHPAAQAAFGALSYTRQKEYVAAIAEAKREETRAARVARTIEVLLAGQK